MARRQLVGIVVSDRMMKTIVIRVTRTVRHRLYPRVIHRSKKFKAHDGGLGARMGDEVRVEETRRLSKDKQWRLVEIIRRAEQEAVSAPPPAQKEAAPAAEKEVAS